MSYLLHSSVVLETGEKLRFHTMLHFSWETEYTSIVFWLFLKKKLNTDKENKVSSVQLQGSYNAALEYVHLVRNYISFFLFSNSTILGLAANNKVKEKAQMFARRQISTTSRPFYLTLIRSLQHKKHLQSIKDKRAHLKSLLWFNFAWFLLAEEWD